LICGGDVSEEMKEREEEEEEEGEGEGVWLKIV